MQYLKFIAVVFILYFLGLILSPLITPMLVSEATEGNSTTALVDYKGAQYKIDLAEIRDGDLPATVKIGKVTRIPTVSGEGKVILQKGDMVTLLNRKDASLIVEKPDGSGKGAIKASDTDLFTQLAKQIYDKEAGQGGGPVAAVKPTPAAVPTPAATPTPAAMPDKKADAMADTMPDKKADAMADTMPDKKADTMPAPSSTPSPTAPAGAGAGDLGPDEVVALMKESISGGAVKEFKNDQVKGWKAGENETIDGTEYQTGLAAYEAATIFGVRPVQAKALIKGGKVVRWVFAKSGMEIQ